MGKGQSSQQVVLEKPGIHIAKEWSETLALYRIQNTKVGAMNQWKKKVENTEVQEREEGTSKAISRLKCQIKNTAEDISLKYTEDTSFPKTIWGLKSQTQQQVY